MNKRLDDKDANRKRPLFSVRIQGSEASNVPAAKANVTKTSMIIVNFRVTPIAGLQLPAKIAIRGPTEARYFGSHNEICHQQKNIFKGVK